MTNAILCSLNSGLWFDTFPTFNPFSQFPHKPIEVKPTEFNLTGISYSFTPLICNKPLKLSSWSVLLQIHLKGHNWNQTRYSSQLFEKQLQMHALTWVKKTQLLQERWHALTGLQILQAATINIEPFLCHLQYHKFSEDIHSLLAKVNKFNLPFK